MLTTDHRYTKSELYTLLKVPPRSQKGPWNTGYLKYKDEIFIFANMGIAGRTGHDYNNHWKNESLVWYGKTTSNISQPLIRHMLKPDTIVHVFTRNDDRDPFTYHGIGKAVDSSDEVPVKIVWQISEPSRQYKTTSAVTNEVNEPSLYITQAKNDDINETITREYKRRRGQKRFSENLFKVCQGKCCITGCTVKAVLHACHIIPHAESGNNDTSNGLLLRSDIHDLFDTHQIGIHPITLTIHIKKQLLNSEYKSLKDKTLLPRSEGNNPDVEALKIRWRIFNK
jgi:hypothetical protein